MLATVFQACAVAMSLGVVVGIVYKVRDWS